MKSQNDHQFSERLHSNIIPRKWEDFQRFAADVEQAEREGILENCRTIVGNEVVDRLLKGQDIDAEFQHPDAKRRYAAIYIAMCCHEPTERIIDMCVLLARTDKDKDVRHLAVEMLGRIEGPLTAKVVPFLLDLILGEQEDTDFRLGAYRSLVYISGAVSKLQIPAVLTRSIDDIDWAFVESCREAPQ